ncbi:MAG: cell wall-active antibiotics response protein LiaF [Bacillota bacterium]
MKPMGYHRILGLLLVLFGVLLLLDNLDLMPVSVWSLWPLLFFLPALYAVVRYLRRPTGGWVRFSVLVLILAWSGAELAYNLGLTTVSGGEVLAIGWPIVILGLGFSLLIGRPERRREGCLTVLNTDRIGDTHYGRRPWVLDDLEIIHALGDVTVDLTTAIIRPGDHRLVVNVVAGDVTIWLPQDVDVTVKARVTAGELQVLEHRRSGLGVSLEVTEPAPQPGPEPKRVQIEASLLAGELQVRRGTR